MEWKYTKEQNPITYKTGNWDGKTSDLVIAQDIFENTFIAELCEGQMDGHNFSIWYDSKGFDLDVKIVRWMNIPE